MLKAFIFAYGANDSRWGSFVDNLHVNKQDQGRGIGKQLMNEARSWLSVNFAELGVYLLVWESNPAKAFYEHLGGRNAEELKVENPGGGSGQYFRYIWDRPSEICGQATERAVQQ